MCRTILLAAGLAVAASVTLAQPPRDRDRPGQPAQPATPAKPAQPATPSKARPDTVIRTPGQPETPRVDPSKLTPEEMQQIYMEAGQPGEPHRRLQSLVGEWDTQAKFWMGPGEPMESTGVSVQTAILDGRFIVQEYTGDMGGMQFKGIGHNGYDNASKKYIGTWMDNWSTSIMYMEGQYDEASKTITYHGEFTDPFGQRVKDRHTVKLESPNRILFTMYSTKPGQAEQKVGEITYTRRNAAGGTDGDDSRRPDALRDSDAIRRR
jgi:hypothetical protein